MNKASQNRMLLISLLAGGGNTHRHLRIPIELIDIIPTIKQKVLHAMVYEFLYNFPSIFYLVQGINGE